MAYPISWHGSKHIPNHMNRSCDYTQIVSSLPYRGVIANFHIQIKHESSYVYQNQQICTSYVQQSADEDLEPRCGIIARRR